MQDNLLFLAHNHAVTRFAAYKVRDVPNLNNTMYTLQTHLHSRAICSEHKQIFESSSIIFVGKRR